MKKLLFVALAVSALCFVSCDKEKNDNNSVNKYLTLEQQQEVISQSLNLAAGEIDFSAIVPIIDAAADLDGIYISRIMDAITEDSISSQALDKFGSKINGDTIELDFSLLNMGFEFDVQDSIDTSYGDTTLMRIPVLVNCNHNADKTYLILNTQSHKFQLNLLAANNYTSLGVESIDERGKVENNLLILPRQIKLELVIDGKSSGNLELNFDTDLKVKDTPDGLSFQGSKLNISVNTAFGDILSSVSLSYGEHTGITLAGSLSMNNGGKSATQILGVSLKADAEMSGLGESFNESELMAWAMDDSRLKGIEMNMSFMDKSLTGEFRLNNPIENGKVPSSILTIMTADSITSDMAANVANDLKPYIKSGLYINGYKPSQASFEIVSKEIKSEMIDENLLEILNRYQLSPMIRISADNSLVGLDEYFEGIDFATAFRTIESSFNAAFGKYGVELDDILGALVGIVGGSDGGKIIPPLTISIKG